jgi:hypothetical protein
VAAVLQVLAIRLRERAFALVFEKALQIRAVLDDGSHPLLQPHRVAQSTRGANMLNVPSRQWGAVQAAFEAKVNIRGRW